MSGKDSGNGVTVPVLSLAPSIAEEEGGLGLRVLAVWEDAVGDIGEVLAVP
jgi:hypothetical protein